MDCSRDFFIVSEESIEKRTAAKLEPGASEIDLNLIVTHEVMEAVLSFLFLDVANIDWVLLIGVLTAARHLKIPALVHTCINFVRHR